MWKIMPSEILCIRCLAEVDVFETLGVAQVVCDGCGKEATVAEAMDDCFVFMVASATSGLQRDTLQLNVGFMPRQMTAGEDYTAKAKAEEFAASRRAA